MRCILLLLDGLGDRSHPVLSGRTPLQAAHTPNLDKIASLGMNGLFHAHLQGTALPSELAHFLMFGYRLEDFPGRGVVEALGEGLDIRERDVAHMIHTGESVPLVMTGKYEYEEMGHSRAFACHGEVVLSPSQKAIDG
jgi:2,3-bisphosphoglycerate-independent phosphoglycerate mutase